MSRTICQHHLCHSDSTIIQNHFLYCFNVFIGCWHDRAPRNSIVINIFSTFLKQVISQLNLCSAHSRLAKRHSQHFKSPCTFNLIFYTKLNTVCLFDPFFFESKTRLNLFICQNQTDNPKWLIMSTYITTICTNQCWKKYSKVRNIYILYWMSWIKNTYTFTTTRTKLFVSFNIFVIMYANSNITYWTVFTNTKK